MAFIESGSPPRWRSWATGETYPSSPRGGYGVPPVVAYAQDPLEVMRHGFERYRNVLATTDPAQWKWSRPLWEALFGTARAVVDPVPQFVSEGIFNGFSEIARTLPCHICASHFQDYLQTFPRSYMTAAGLMQWLTAFKTEVDLMSKQRQQQQQQQQSPRQQTLPVPHNYQSPQWYTPEHSAAPPSATPWAELREFHKSRGLCQHGALLQYCDFCTYGQGSPTRGFRS
eukprot:TRINITY_DN12054_c0_g1_i1.p1 TRINITY_DN12054_c0_g1~~TRINITY_DN12054_c0_g1_i1.p1  ORF type:complete len:248 (+),score=17.50 TRINITY_DN12054_c0_g1_i1:62-745(+)